MNKFSMIYYELEMQIKLMYKIIDKLYKSSS